MASRPLYSRFACVTNGRPVAVIVRGRQVFMRLDGTGDRSIAVCGQPTAELVELASKRFTLARRHNGWWYVAR